MWSPLRRFRKAHHTSSLQPSDRYRSSRRISLWAYACRLVAGHAGRIRRTSMDDDSDRASARRWHMPRWGALTLVGLVMAAAVGVLAEEVRKPGVYWSDVRVRFVAPTTLTKQNSLQVTGQSLIMMAGAVGQMVDDTNGPRPASPDATLVGLGVRSGWWVVLPN